MHAEAQATEYKQKFKTLEAMVEQVRSEGPSSHASSSSSSVKLEKKGPRPRGSGSPFKCIGLGMANQVKYDMDEELASARFCIEELEALAADRQKKSFNKWDASSSKNFVNKMVDSPAPEKFQPAVALTGTAKEAKSGPALGMLDIGVREKAYLCRNARPGLRNNETLLADIKELKEIMCGEDDALCAFITGNGKKIVNHLKYKNPDKSIHEDFV